ncbi:DUF3597 domain-containing protein [Rhizobium sp. LC145]|jgi:hypothetical protein|uniref:DUF3597 domain-containing protein n=1 Tax=Rhizobium sp. LC145 TaxID=1120688 RepID=UPI00062A4BCD|nr:DUF3597 domain-containing protein [Rhizobium sp. LC145]KKX29502.1 5'-nucleotidase [Rhizobium sp. LC145]TKT66110.1 DUF3597 domain-containing protein [Rhizobiaceae bacterium LC148]
MGIFDKIKSAIFGQAKPATPAPADAPKTVTPTSPVSASMSGASASAGVAAPAGSPAPVTTAAAPAATAPSPSGAVDIGPILDAAVKKSGQKLNWKNSIVDLMKALNLDSSLAARKELADELGYTGDKGDSAAMNVWLHKALMKKLAENGGVVPAELTD